MFEAARQYLGLRLALWRLRKMETPLQSFTHAFSDARRAIVVLPLTSTPPGLSPQGLLSFLREKLRDENITVVAGTQETYLHLLLPKSTIFRLPATDLTSLFLPPQALIERIAEKKFDLAIDLNIDFLLASAYICRASKAPVRVGFSSPHAEAFFNFLLQRDVSRDPGAVYDRLMACLKMF